MYGRLLYLFVTEGFDKVFEYPILPKPACFAHPDVHYEKTEWLYFIITRRRNLVLVMLQLLSMFSFWIVCFCYKIIAAG